MQTNFFCFKLSVLQIQFNSLVDNIQIRHKSNVVRICFKYIFQVLMIILFSNFQNELFIHYFHCSHGCCCNSCTLKTTTIHLNLLNWHQHKEFALPMLSRLTSSSLQPSRTATQLMTVSKPFKPWPPALLQLDKMSKESNKYQFGNFKKESDQKI